MTSPTKDGSATGISTGSTTCAATLTTTLTNDVIVCVVGYELNAAQRNVTSVTAAGLVFVNRAKIQGGSSHVGIEVWWAPSAAALTAKTITVNMDFAPDDMAMVVFGVNGAHDINNPWDPNGALPSLSISATPSITTSKANNLLLGALMNGTASGGGTIAGGWTQIAIASNAGGANFAVVNTAFESVAATQAAAGGGVQLNGLGQQALWEDAITADATSAIETATVGIAIGKMNFSAGEAKSETPTVNIPIAKMNFTINEARMETTTVGLAIAKPQIAAFVLDLSALNKLRQFNVFG